MGVIKSIQSILRKNSAGSDFQRRRINLVEGTNVTLTVADDSANNEVDVTIAAAAGGGAPTDATYITQTANGSLSAEQALASLSSGIMKVATTTGVITSVAAPSGAVVGDTDTQTLTNKTLTSPTVNTPIIATPTMRTWDGWEDANDSWSYSSVDGATGVITVTTDATTKYSVGMRIKLTQTTVKYFIVTAVAATTLTVWGGTDYTLANAAISANFYSPMKTPLGFPADVTKWTVEVSITDSLTQASPSAVTWYNLGSGTISIPIGSWIVSYWGALGIYDATARTQCIIKSTLSTANNTESNSKFTAILRQYSPSAIHYQYEGDVTRTNIIVVAAKTSYYLNVLTTEASFDSLGWNIGTISGATIIRAICAYL